MQSLKDVFKKNKKKDEIDKWEDKLASIKEVLEMADEPMSYDDIAKETNLPHDETFRIISWYFSKITKETTSYGFIHPDFYLFGDTVKEISSNLGYKVLKSRLDIGEKTKKYTRGYLR